MTRKTSYDELYATIGSVITAATGRSWWRTTGMQAAPNVPYATIYLQQGSGLENQMVQSNEIDKEVETEVDEVFRQIPWNTTAQDVVIDFYRSATNNTALDAASRFRSALYLEQRFWDLWVICGLVGRVQLTDISAIFRTDKEPRTQVKFSIIANIADPAPLAGTDIFDIQTQQIEVIHDRTDDVETTITVDIENT